MFDSIEVEEMKINPYRLTEYVLLAMGIAACLVVFCTIITYAGWWRPTGLAVLLIVVLTYLYAGIDAWKERKRQWDVEHKQ